MNILYLYADTPSEWNCSEWRCAVPSRAFMKSSRHQSAMLDVGSWAIGNQEAKDRSNWADVIVAQRLFFGTTSIAVEYWKARGKTIIGDVDDAYSLIPHSVRTYRFWKEGIIKVPSKNGEVDRKLEFIPAEQQTWGAKLLNAISAPSKQLLDDWSRYVEQVIYVPNYIEINNYILRERPVWDPDKIVIGWGGSLSHTDSFKLSGVVPALCKLLSNNPKVILYIAGGGDSLVKLFLNSQAPYDRIKIKPWTTVEKWPGTLANFQIGLIPLHGSYDKRRSFIKPLEYAAMGIPWIGSKSQVYEEFGQFGIQVENTPEAWYQALNDALSDLGTLRRHTERAFELAMSYSIYENLENIVKAYESVKNPLISRDEIFSQSQEKAVDELPAQISTSVS